MNKTLIIMCVILVTLSVACAVGQALILDLELIQYLPHAVMVGGSCLLLLVAIKEYRKAKADELHD